MWPAALSRLLRRRIVYIVLGVLLLVYGFGHLLDRVSNPGAPGGGLRDYRSS